MKLRHGTRIIGQRGQSPRVYKEGRVRSVVGEAEKRAAGRKNAKTVDKKLQYYQGAEALLPIRALYKSGRLDEFHNWRVKDLAQVAFDAA